MAAAVGHCPSFLFVFSSLFILLLFVIINPAAAYVHGHHHRHGHLHTSLDSNKNGSRRVSPRDTGLASSASASGQNDYTCGPDKPCSNKACCGEDGWCGYSPKYCGTGCQSNCDAKAECGQYAATPGKTCPLNVCCSEHGFCGTTTDFCSTGCQSNCGNPKPNAAPSDVQKIIIGYWETWNMKKPCGTMGPGEIPVHLLTHLFVSFGYINSQFQVTNMDGIDPDIYKNIGNVKARNPSLKIIIALGGWTFSDPGPWQAVFPTLASTQANRAIFIQNLLGFLSEYGYDGVDFDCEYPGAEDRGGSEGDGENYTLLLKELREAINASGRDYIITFTAPSSYWYLRHFDLKGMENHADWINLMTYDLHGVWDRDNPIGSQVLAHTNLTEIDLALDLFWRVGIEPSSIVLGLGFYGRSFELESASCWKPGCTFKGPGSAGPCSNTPGILAYNEIMDIMEKTGGTAYLDETAAVRYLVYDDHSWISFDDVRTFQMKIDYARRMGLHGLMIWAIDLDNSNLEALSAISNGEIISGTNGPFTLVDLENLFPPDILPPPNVKTNYGLVNFGSGADAGEVDPNETGFGFILITGESHVVSSLKRREGEAEPFIFLDCPEDVLDQPAHKEQRARVACFNDDVKGCFQVMERGIEGTILEMPDNCAPNSFARAVSIKVSKDQSIPVNTKTRLPTSEVFELAFDLNFNLTRRDTESGEIRIDYSNAPGYWKAAVDSPGVQSSDPVANRLAKKYWAGRSAHWEKMVHDATFKVDKETVRIYENVRAPVLWQTVDNCTIDGDEYQQGFAAQVEGKVEAVFTYGFSMIAALGDLLNVKEAYGFLNVEGSSDLTYSLGGIGNLDLSKSGKGNPAMSNSKPIAHKGHMINAGATKGMVVFQPYHQHTYLIATANSSNGDIHASGPVYFDGKLAARVKSDYGGFDVDFPIDEEETNSRNGDRTKNRISIPSSQNDIYNLNGNSGKIALASVSKFGLKVRVDILDRKAISVPLTDMSISYSTLVDFGLSAGSESCATTEITTFADQSYTLDDDATIGWNPSEKPAALVNDMQTPSEGSKCYTERPSMGESSVRGIAPNEDVGQMDFVQTGSGVDVWAGSKLEISCTNCLTCGKDKDKSYGCCGCANLDLEYGYDDIEDQITCHPDQADGEWPGFGSSLSRRDISNDDKSQGIEKRHPDKASMLPKEVGVCDDRIKLGAPHRYPAFPDSPYKDWESIDNGRWQGVSAYWGNTSLSCSDWTVAAMQPFDTAIVHGPNGIEEIRTRYQTEHVFEGQLIGDFFTQWLDKGAINNQRPELDNPPTKISCGLTEQYILTVNRNIFPWKLGGEFASFFELLLAELGNESHLDRLTILKSRPNGMKGSMFTGNQPSRYSTYAQMSPQEQLAATKEMGMVFTYLNDPEVWKAFCGTYDAIYELMGDFDDWYAQHGSIAIPSLQVEWKEYIQVVLSSLVTRGKETFDFQYLLAKIRTASFTVPGTAVFMAYWVNNVFINKPLIRISGTCAYLDPI